MYHYGRRKVTIVTKLGTFVCLSGQWVGHRYGNANGDGSERQIRKLSKEFVYNLKRSLPEAIFDKLTYDFRVDVSNKIYWNCNGYTGDILEVPRNLRKYFPNCNTYKR